MSTSRERDNNKNNTGHFKAPKDDEIEDGRQSLDFTATRPKKPQAQFEVENLDEHPDDV